MPYLSFKQRGLAATERVRLMPDSRASRASKAIPAANWLRRLGRCKRTNALLMESHARRSNFARRRFYTKHFRHFDKIGHRLRTHLLHRVAAVRLHSDLSYV